MILLGPVIDPTSIASSAVWNKVTEGMERGLFSNGNSACFAIGLKWMREHHL